MFGTFLTFIVGIAFPVQMHLLFFNRIQSKTLRLKYITHRRMTDILLKRKAHYWGKYMMCIFFMFVWFASIYLSASNSRLVISARLVDLCSGKAHMLVFTGQQAYQSEQGSILKRMNEGG
jgi:hypothetical protein